MLKKIGYHFAWIFAFSGIVFLAFPIAATSIVDSLRVGQIVSITPFDARMRSAGLFNIGTFFSHSAAIRSIDDLFASARSFRYVPDRDGDHWQSAEETDRRRAGDCEDKAIWLFKQLVGNGVYNVRLVVGRYRQMDNQLHVWVMCTDSTGELCILDPAKQRRVWRAASMDSGFYQPIYGFDGKNKYKYVRAS